jgi:1-acyl-sn-glycerol-3-phosphate acyltransferase
MSMVKTAVRHAAARVPFPYRPPTVPGGVERSNPEPRYGAFYDTAWARRYPARLARVGLVDGLLRPTVRVLAEPERAGEDHLSDLDGAAIFAANHHSHLDTPLMLTSIPEPWRHKLFVGAAADYFFRNRVTSTISALCIGAIPVERTRISRRSADEAAALLDDGWSMLIFPEGGRSPDGWGQPFRGGAAYLSLRCGTPVVPVHVEGTDRILPKGRNLPRPSPTTVSFGHPMYPREGEDSRRFAVRIEQAVAALADEATTDWWQARTRAHAGTTPPLSGPDAPSWRRSWSLGDRSSRRRRQKRRWPELR